MADDTKCPHCGAVLDDVLASHNYSITYSSEQEKWVKSEGNVEYRCGNCIEELDIHDIEDILKQVDEL